MDVNLSAAISAAPDKVLVDIVKLGQKHGMRGSDGNWKEFLNVHDRNIGSSLSDPARRKRETLISFLKTVTAEEHLKFLANVVQAHLNREVLNQLFKDSSDDESPQQRLVRSTLEHPFYLPKYAFPSYEKEWLVTKIPKKSKLMKANDMLAVDCEMVLCEDGTDALVRVCVVDCNLQVKLDELINPGKPVADYRTEITGVSSGDLDGVSCSLVDIQKSMKKLLSKGTILVGHGLYNDLQALKIDHARVVDTSFIFKTSDGKTPSLSSLCKAVLGYELRKEGSPHNCLDDACAAMKVVLAKIERGVDTEIPLIQEHGKDVWETEMAKLLIHRIPANVRQKELQRIFPQSFTFELKLNKKAEGAPYSMHVIFKDKVEANQAFEILNANPNKDSSGLPQKRISFRLNTGETVSVFVRKMRHDYTGDEVSLKKRAFEGEDSGNAKKQKTDQYENILEEDKILQQLPKQKYPNHCCDLLKEIDGLKKELELKELEQYNKHVEEIEKLKHEIKSKDFQICMQDKMISGLKKRLEEEKLRKRK
ncbi:hypothetical protein Tsubulata_060008 [Turnera subulata]|uniref:Exonuclease domain-containing protein n=1 Tax=Turnera subulata TaxID=218843 RepID=A0A516IJF6_9ROSI|nr:hypothetical protein Tsubulata_060008 [Turnera subulata]